MEGVRLPGEILSVEQFLLLYVRRLPCPKHVRVVEDLSVGFSTPVTSSGVLLPFSEGSMSWYYVILYI